MKVALYLRVSHASQVEDGVSLDAQIQRLRAWCVANDHEAAVVGRDEGVSGAVHPDKRPGLSHLLGALERGEAQGLAVVAFDRLSRSTRDLLDLADRFRRESWFLFSLREGLQTDNAIGQFCMTLFGALASMERALVAERTQAALQSLNRAGKLYSGTPPFGFKADPNTRVLVRDETTAPLLARIAAYHDEGRKPLWIARMLGTHPRTGQPWTRANVQAVLRTLAKRRKVHGEAAIPRETLRDVGGAG